MPSFLSVPLMTSLILLSGHSHASALSYSARSEHIDRNEFCYLKANIPVLIANDGSSADLRRFAESANAAWAGHVADLKKEFNAVVKEKDMCKDFSYSNQVVYSFSIMTELDAEVASLLFTHYEFTGGAHGLASLQAETFSTVTGKRYANLGAFFDEKNLATIKAAILKKLKVDPDFDPEFGYNRWASETTSLTKINNFYFMPHGLTIFFQQYEVGPYAAGNISAFFDWQDLKSLGYREPTL